MDMTKTRKVAPLLLLINWLRFSSSMNSPCLAKKMRTTATINCRNKERQTNVMQTILIADQDLPLVIVIRLFICAKFDETSAKLKKPAVIVFFVAYELKMSVKPLRSMLIKRLLWTVVLRKSSSNWIPFGSVFKCTSLVSFTTSTFDFILKKIFFPVFLIKNTFKNWQYNFKKIYLFILIIHLNKSMQN